MVTSHKLKKIAIFINFRAIKSIISHYQILIALEKTASNLLQKEIGEEIGGGHKKHTQAGGFFFFFTLSLSQPFPIYLNFNPCWLDLFCYL